MDWYGMLKAFNLLQKGIRKVELPITENRQALLFN